MRDELAEPRYVRRFLLLDTDRQVSLAIEATYEPGQPWLLTLRRSDCGDCAHQVTERLEDLSLLRLLLRRPCRPRLLRTSPPPAPAGRSPRG